MDKGVWQATVHGIAKSRTRLSNEAHITHISRKDPLCSFLWLSTIPLCLWGVCVCDILFIHSSVDGHLRCFHVLAIVDSAALNLGTHVSFGSMVFSGHMPRSVIAGSHAGPPLRFLKKPPQKSREEMLYFSQLYRVCTDHLELPPYYHPENETVPEPGGLEEMPDSGLLTF